MAALFNNENALLFHIFCRIINDVRHTGKPLTVGEIKERIRKAFPGKDFFSGEAESELIDTLFPARDDDKKRTPFYTAQVPSLPSAAERLWLKTMLLDESAAFLLPQDLREKLLARLADTEDFSLSDVWKKRQAKGDDPAAEPLRGRLALIWSALRDRKKLRYVNIDKNGTVHDKTLPPCRLEYDAAMNRYALVVWDEAENRAVKINIHRLKTLEIAKESIPPDTGKKFMDFLTARKREVTFRLVDTKNTGAFDRCYSLFSAYDKDACAEEENVYTIKVYYQDFDRREIIARLLSLGAAAIVLDPPDLRAEIIERLQQSWELYKE